MADGTEIIPRDDPVDEKYRVYASISFALLLLGIGIPLWWHTTAVLRVALPYSGIADLSNRDIKILCKITIASISKSHAELLAEEISRKFENCELHKIYIIKKVISSGLTNSAFTLHDHETIARDFNVGEGELLLLEAPNLGEVLVGTNRSVFFPSETSGLKLAQIMSQWLLKDKSLAVTRNALTDPTKYRLDDENRRRFPASPTYDVLLTVINPEPEKLNVNWDLPAIVEDYLELFLDHVAAVANFSVKSQWLYLMPLDVRPRQVPDSSHLGRHYALSEDVLPQLITPLEKKIASQVSLHPCINLVIYMVPCETAPLRIYTREGHRMRSLHNLEGFLSPRWGAVVISNPESEICAALNENELVKFNVSPATIMGAFLTQLRRLLGIPDPDDIILGAQVIPLVDSKPRQWELDALLRVRAIEQLTSAKLTLQSLAQLLEEISNIVITDTVANRIKSVLELVQRSAEKLERGQLTEGFLLSKKAFITAEAAFTDPSLLALLYFPEDQNFSDYNCSD
ncbi:GPI transamidase component PIG-S isoform X2 [Diachasma alloeum]|uniref:GPI transamidase component PIG-S isoform X2 n=1 Tax=Diachasma alloeum TaxID=454923 RepID=UPI00073827E2|nr:GPI transamidase component PIG-S isoform X2 [Diachasma alloeum]